MMRILIKELIFNPRRYLLLLCGEIFMVCPYTYLFYAYSLLYLENGGGVLVIKIGRT